MLRGTSELESKKRQRMPAAVQRLYETCVEVFSDVAPATVPAAKDVSRLRDVLDNIDASDVGLTPNLPYFWNIEPDEVPPVTYLPIYECEKFEICIFCLPPSGVIPLHNHPGMTVLSKLLFGTMHIKSYDWVDGLRNSQMVMNNSHSQPLRAKLAMVKTDAIFSAPCESSVLYPADGGNMHRFTAMTACAVLDVLGPPYSDVDGRHCTYYTDIPYEKFSGNSSILLSENRKYAWLEEREKPRDYFVLPGRYRGPRIVDH